MAKTVVSAANVIAQYAAAQSLDPDTMTATASQDRGSTSVTFIIMERGTGKTLATRTYSGNGSLLTD